VALCGGGTPDNVGAFLPALTTTPRMAANPVPRSYLEAVGMSTQFTDPFVIRSYKKKDPKTGSTKNLMGYKVGSRAPSMSRSSGTTNFQATGKFGYKGEREANTDINVAREEKKKIAVDFGIGLSAASLLVAILS
jgi:hypothetical protein